MSWRERIDSGLRGAYRGVPFHVARADSQAGRRWLVHEYPRRDRPYSEDMGRKAREYRLELFVAGDDYDLQRDALIKAFDAPGSATLDHPYLGRVDAVVTDVGWSESNRDGGVCTFRVTFAESGEQNLPTTTLDTRLEVFRLAGMLQLQSILDFINRWSVDGLLGWSLSAVERDIAEVVRSLDRLVGGITAPILAAIRKPGEIAGTLVGGYQRIRSSVALPGRALSGLSGRSAAPASGIPATAGGELITLPELPPASSHVLLTVSTPNRALRTLRETALSGQTVAEVAKQAALGGAALSEVDTPERRQRQQNRVAAMQLSGRIATLEAARLAADTHWQTRDDAMAASREVLELLDAQLTTPEPIADQVYAATVALRAAVVEDLRVRATALPGLTSFTPQVITSSLVVAQRLYGDATRADEIAMRNAARRPGALPGGMSLEVLSE